VNRSFWTSVLVLLLCACTGEQTNVTDSSARVADHLVPHDGGTLYRRLGADISTLNPIISSTAYDRLVANYLFTPLLNYDRNLRPVAGLAKTWRVSSDGRLYRFELNERATFSDGVPVRASDVVFTLRKIVDPAAGAMQISGSFELLDLSHTRAINENTVEVAFREVLATQLTSFTDVLVLPEHVYGTGSFRDDFHNRAVGSGPYRLVRREAGKELRLERRADYWGVRPHIQTVVFKVIADHNTAWNALQQGVVDETLITSDRWTRVQGDSSLARKIDFRHFYGANYNAIAWNNRHELLADKEIRRALAMCIPVESLAKEIYQGTARGLSGPFTPDEGAYNPAVPIVPYDPTQAARVFASHGWVDSNGDGILDRRGKSFSLELIVIAGNAPTQSLAQMLQAEWKKIGLDIKLVLLDGATAIQRVVAGNYDAAYVGWSLDADPDPFGLFHSSAIPPHGQNVVFYSNPEADRLIERGRRNSIRRRGRRCTGAFMRW
jgi:peptide/nickel transport system substrate-binding protein